MIDARLDARLDMPLHSTQRPRPEWAVLFSLGILLILLYARIGVKLVSDWYEYPDDSHGFLIPFFALFLLWERRDKLRAITPTRSWPGLYVVLIGLFLLVLGVFGADLFLSRFSFVVLLTGITLTLLGPAILKEVRFILLVLLLAIPLPALVLQQITFPLQILASKLSSAALPLFGVPVLRDGNVIQLPGMQLEVAEACSGLHSLVSLLTVAIFYGYFLEPSVWRRILLALASLPIAVAANAVRIVGTGLCVQYWDPVKAMGFFHEFSGWLIFLVSLACLYAVHAVMRAYPTSSRKAAAR